MSSGGLVIRHGSRGLDAVVRIGQPGRETVRLGYSTHTIPKAHHGRQ